MKLSQIFQSMVLSKEQNEVLEFLNTSNDGLFDEDSFENILAVSVEERVIHIKNIVNTAKDLVVDNSENTELSKWNLKFSGIKFKSIEIKGIWSSIKVEQYSSPSLSLKLNDLYTDLFEINPFTNISIDSNNTLIDEFIAENSNIENSKLNNFEFFSDPFIKITEIKYLTLKASKLKAIIDVFDIGDFDLSNIEEGQIEIRNGKINNYFLSNICKNTEILFYSVWGTNFMVPRIKLVNCEFGRNIIFDNCDLSKHRLELDNSDIQDIKINNTILPNSINYDINPFNKKNLDLKLVKYTVTQLKSLALKYNDSITEAQCKIFEQQLNFLLTPFSVKAVPLKIKQWSNFLSNNFGSNWLLPIGWYLALGALLYWWAYSINGLSWDWTTFAQFLIPTHKLDIYGDVEIKNLAKGTGYIDLFARIVFGYLIYQTVSAFRKLA